MFNIDLPFEVQGVCRFKNNKLIIGDSEPFSEILFNSYGAYIRETGNEVLSKGIAIECDEYIYKTTKEYAFVYFDFNNNYTLDSVRATLLSQLNQKDINVKTVKSDFETIKKEEGLDIKDANLLKITFEYVGEFINDCNGLVCPC